MDADWITSPSAQRVLQHDADTRPAWLWSADGLTLLWQNDAARLFLAKLKKSGLKLAQPAEPIKGQVARNIRLGSPGRTSLARIQFLAGDKPASSTCATTPLAWQDGQIVLLVVSVDPIATEILEAAKAAIGGVDGEPVLEPQAEDETEPVADELMTLDPEPAIEPVAEPEVPAVVAQEAVDKPETEAPLETVDAPESVDAQAYERELDNWREAEAEHDAEAFPPLPVPVVPPVDDLEQWHEMPEPEQAIVERAEKTSRLSRLVDRLAEDQALYAPLSAADDDVITPAETAEAEESSSEPEAIEPEVSEPEVTPTLFKVTGRGFIADVVEPAAPDGEVTEAEADLAALELLDAPADESTPIDEPVAVDGGLAMADDAIARMQQALSDSAPEAPEVLPDPDTIERVSRYNFDELSRILTDRVSEPAPSASVPAVPQKTGALINLGGETLVLNRLPLGILVFRDQQVLFANRAITEMVGYGSVEALRAAGLAAVFPAAGPEGQEAGPVNHLVQRDGTLVPVTARLQSISWQGRPALMLSASTTEVRTGHEAAVRDFAQTFAELRGDGFLETARNGVISAITLRTAALLGQDGVMLEGKPLSTLVAGGDVAALQEFLERPARFAETARPCLTVRASSGKAEINLFAQGQAGIITGYFGFVRAREAVVPRLALTGQSDAEPALLARISRGVRRPLNTIIGFSDLIRSAAFGALGNERYEGYAEDIATASHEIAALVDELDDYARLRDGRYLPQRASIELTSLLESCVIRIRQQASSARVIVRNAISESLPRITADRASLAQAVLNLLASAIDQTPTGGAVVISAQREDDGGIAIHVRDSSTNAVDMAERFVVFRDGVGRDGQMMAPVRSSVGLALTRSLLAVNAFSLSVDPAGEQGMLFSLLIPADLVDRTTETPA